MNEKNDEDRSPRLCNAPSSKAPGASCTESTFLAPRPVFFQGLPTGRKYVKYKYEKKHEKKDHMEAVRSRMQVAPGGS